MAPSAWRSFPRLGLLGQASFRRLWLAQTVSWAGSGIGSVALPLVAVTGLGASAWQMGLLRASELLPALLLSLFVGVWVDRLPRRPVLVSTDLGRAALLVAVPLLALGGILRIELLYLIGFLVGVLGVTADITSTTFAPTLVRREELVEANAKLQVSRSAAFVAGPAAAGPLVQAIGAPLVVGLDALSFLLSGLLTTRIGAAETPPPPRTRRDMRREIAEGWRALWEEPLVRAITVATAVAAFGGGIRATIYVLYATRELGLGPAALGIVLALNGVAAVVGGTLAGPIARRLGVGRTLLSGQSVLLGAASLVPLASVAPLPPAALLGAGQMLNGLGLSVCSVTQISVRQALTPSHLLGRVNATRRVMVFGVQPIAALVGGLVGETAGLVPALLLALCVELTATAMLWPLRGVRSVDG
jgi:MFS family permease